MEARGVEEVGSLASPGTFFQRQCESQVVKDIREHSLARPHRTLLLQLTVHLRQRHGIVERMVGSAAIDPEPMRELFLRRAIAR